jgi:hypothetical protein
MNLQPYLEDMLGELESGWLEVVLTPSRFQECAERGGKIRVVQNQNAEWYKNLCNKFTSQRGRKRRLHDTSLKRRNVIQILRTLIKNNKSNSYLAPYLLEEAEARKKENDNIIPF